MLQQKHNPSCCEGVRASAQAQCIWYHVWRQNWAVIKISTDDISRLYKILQHQVTEAFSDDALIMGFSEDDVFPLWPLPVSKSAAGPAPFSAAVSPFLPLPKTPRSHIGPAQESDCVLKME